MKVAFETRLRRTGEILHEETELKWCKDEQDAEIQVRCLVSKFNREEEERFHRTFQVRDFVRIVKVSK